MAQITEDIVNDATIYRVVHGSRAYGTHLPTSDRDEKGVCILTDPCYYLGSKNFDQKDSGWNDGVDRCIYSLKKFVSLALRCNPNIIEILYVEEEEDILHIDDFGKRLRDARSIFLSQLAAGSFMGYATNQLRRIQGHNKWIDSPPPQPDPKDFIKKTKLKAGQPAFNIELESHVFTVRAPDHGSVEIEHLDKNALKLANKRRRDYTRWVEQRNPERAKLERDHGYDTKHAAHLIRLLKMGKEILNEGVVRVRRPDAQELLDIRNGKLTYQELLDYANALTADFRKAEKSAVIPPEPDFLKAEKLVLEMIKERVNF